MDFGIDIEYKESKMDYNDPEWEEGDDSDEDEWWD